LKVLAAQLYPPKVDEAEPQIDRAAELQKKWNTARGQVWKLGEHRLMCGDSTSKEDVEKLMGGERAELLFTSPPYADMRTYKGGDMSMDYLIGFIPAFSPFINYCVVNLGIKRHDGEVVRYWDAYIEKARECGLKLLSWNVWDKGEAGSIGSQSAMFAIEHEWLFVFGAKPKNLYRTVEKRSESDGRLFDKRRSANGDIKISSRGNDYERKNLPSIAAVTLEHSNIRSSHPAVFPAELPRLYIEAMVGGDELVAEPFSGSGTTIIACEKLNRKCRAMEIAPEYVAVALERWSMATGKTPEIVGSEQWVVNSK
jgi:DNA modification methylase